jgi:hypothetical protein
MTTPYDDLAAKARAAMTEEAQLTADGYGAEALTMMLRSQRRDLATGVLALLADLLAARDEIERLCAPSRAMDAFVATLDPTLPDPRPRDALDDIAREVFDAFDAAGEPEPRHSYDVVRDYEPNLATKWRAAAELLRAARARVERMERVVRLAHEATRALWESYHDGGWEMVHHEDDAGRDCPEDDTCECGGRLAAELLSKLDVEAKRALDALETP